MVSAWPEPTASSGGGGAVVRDGMEALAGGKSILGVAIVEARRLRPPDASVGGSARQWQGDPRLDPRRCAGEAEAA
jgi:hypothetical protein